MSDSRAEFEAMVKDRFECTEFSLARTSDGRYYNHVGANTFGGRIPPDWASVDMLWKAWQASRAQSREYERGFNAACKLQADIAQPERKLTDAEIIDLHDSMFPRVVFANDVINKNICKFARALLAAQPAAATVPDEVVQQFQEAFTKWENDELDFGEHLALLVYEHLLKDKIPAAQAQDDGAKQ